MIYYGTGSATGINLNCVFIFCVVSTYLRLHGCGWSAYRKRSVASGGKGNNEMGSKTRTAIMALVVWYTAECSQNLMNKLLMQNPKHLLGSLQLASVNTFCSAVLDFLIIKLYFYPNRAAFLLTTMDTKARARSQPPLVTWARLMELLPVAFAMIVSKSLTMAAFKYIPLSLSNTIKMTQAAFTVVLGYLWLGKLPSKAILLTLLPLLCGAALTVGTDLSFNFIGLIAIFGATCCATFQNLYFKNRVDLSSYPMYKTYRSNSGSMGTKRKKGKDSSAANQSALVGRMVLVHMIIATSAFVMSVFPAVIQAGFAHDSSDSTASSAESSSSQMSTYVQILIGSVMTWLGSVGAYIFLASVSTALTHNIAKLVQRMLLIIISVVIFHNPISLLSATGMALALFGVFCYSLVAQREKKRMKKMQKEERRRKRDTARLKKNAAAELV